MKPMKCNQLDTSETGKKTAIQISLKEWRALREDIGDVSISASRKAEPTVSWDELKAERDRKG